MIKNFLLEYAKLVSNNPDNISIKEEQLDENTFEIKIFTDKEDIGRLIGKEGKVINALKAFITGCKAKEDKIYKITITTYEEQK